MTNLAQAISAAHDANEKRLSADVARVRPEFDADAEFRLRQFADWCRNAGVRHTPCRPEILALYCRSLHQTGVVPEKILLTLEAIQAAHDHHGLPSPVATAAVRSELGRITNTEAPRSWKKNEKLVFMGLPVEVRAAVARRESQRETDLRRGQNDTAEFRKAAEAKRLEEAELYRLMATEFSTAITSNKEETKSDHT